MNNFNNFHHNLRLNGRCPVCNTMYDLQKIKILAEREQNVLTYIQCSQCGSALLSMLSMSPQGLQAVGLVTDMASEEVMRFEQGQPISSDEVVAMHQQLENDPHFIEKII